MPNHTDVRLFMAGEPRKIEALRQAMKELQLSNAMWKFEKLKEKHGYPGRWYEPRFERESRDQVGVDWASNASKPWGLLADIEGQFTLEAGGQMPVGMHIEESSDSDKIERWLGGERNARFEEWEHLIGKSKEEALEWIKTHQPRIHALHQMRSENIKKHGVGSWYRWSVQNWGTKWNAYDAIEGKVDKQGRRAFWRFQTAWSPPIPGLMSICERFGVSCCVGYVDEGGGFSGWTLLDENGEAIEEKEVTGRALWSEIRAKSEQEALRLCPSAPPPSMRSFETGWAAKMAKGKPFDKKYLKDPGSPTAGSPEAISQTLAALMKMAAGGQKESVGLEWIKGLIQEGVIQWTQPSIEGMTLGELLREALWEPAVREELESIPDQSKASWAQELMFAALGGKNNGRSEQHAGLALLAQSMIPAENKELSSSKHLDLKLGAETLMSLIERQLRTGSMDEKSAGEVKKRLDLVARKLEGAKKRLQWDPKMVERVEARQQQLKGLKSQWEAKLLEAHAKPGAAPKINKGL